MSKSRSFDSASLRMTALFFVASVPLTALALPFQNVPQREAGFEARNSGQAR